MRKHVQRYNNWRLRLIELMRCYAHLSNEHLAGYVDRMIRLRVVGNELNSYDLEQLSITYNQESC